MDLDDVITRYHRALDEFSRGDPDALKALYSEAEDVTWLTHSVLHGVGGRRSSKHWSTRRDGCATARSPALMSLPAMWPRTTTTMLEVEH